MHSDDPTPPQPTESIDRVPLVVGLDGTLLRTDSLIESIFVLARMNPLSLLKLPVWLLEGTARFKQQLAAAALPATELLPVHAEVLAYLREQKSMGRSVILATAADQRLAEQIGGKFGLFDDILASDGRTTLSGERKRDRLIARWGPGGFDYAGNGSRDYPVWCAARRALLVSPPARLVRRLDGITPVEKIFRDPGARWADYLHELRPLHWVKNGLVFMPLALAHRVFEADLAERAALAFLAFCLLASGQYLLNDLLDLPSDRRHARKKERRLASGRIKLAHAIVMMPLMMIAAFAIAWQLSVGVAGVLALYLMLMIGYSLKLKDLPIVDALVLAIGYALRVAAGSIAVHIAVSEWLLSFCMFLFFSLALIKRYAELVTADPAAGPIHVRGYFGGDKIMLVAQGIASGYLSVLVLALYTNSETIRRLYARPDCFWVIGLMLLYWVSYLWMMAARGRIHDDPVIFALTDRMSLATIAIAVSFALLAL